MIVKSFAKLNLSLNVFEKQGNFHPIDSVMVSVGLCDTVEVSLNAGGINVRCDKLVDTVATKACQEFEKQFGKVNVDVAISKDIPVGAGLGGSSADACAVIYCLCKLYGVDVNSPSVAEVCARCGSDVNFMLRGGLARVTGRGEKVESLPYVETYFVVTAFDKVNLTKKVYDDFDLSDRQSGFVDNGLLAKCIESKDFVRMQTGNMLQSVACTDGYADGYLRFCESQGIATTMTGSGSAFFVVCDGFATAENLARLLRANGFDSQAVSSTSCGIED